MLTILIGVLMVVTAWIGFVSLYVLLHYKQLDRFFDYLSKLPPDSTLHEEESIEQQDSAKNGHHSR